MENLIEFEDYGKYESRQYIPEHIRESIEDYLIKGWSPGSFLEAMFAGDLFRAASNADYKNGPNMQAIALWISYSLPYKAWGSYEKIKNWKDDVDGIRSNFLITKEKEKFWRILKN